MKGTSLILVPIAHPIEITDIPFTPCFGSPSLLTIQQVDASPIHSYHHTAFPHLL